MREGPVHGTHDTPVVGAVVGLAQAAVEPIKALLSSLANAGIISLIVPCPIIYSHTYHYIPFPRPRLPLSKLAMQLSALLLTLSRHGKRTFGYSDPLPKPYQPWRYVSLATVTIWLSVSAVVWLQSRRLWRALVRMPI